MTSSSHYDSLVIGSGQSGTPLASHLASLGQKVALVERAHIGGTCINEGCTPTKTLIASGRVAYLARRMNDYGLHEANPGDRGKVFVQDASMWVDMRKVRQRKRDIVESFRGGGESRLEKAGVKVFGGEASFVGSKTVKISSFSKVMPSSHSDETVTADTIYINTGERPSRPELEGLDDIEKARVLDSTSIQELDEVPNHLIVLGGGPIGLEFAQLFRRLGANVTIVQRAAQLLPREDPDAAASMLEVLREDGISVHLSATANGVSPSSDAALALDIETPDGASHTIYGSHILLATGRIPNTDMLNLKAAGVETSPRGHIIVDERLQTSQPHIFALGDVTGSPAFTHISFHDFRVIRADLAGNSTISRAFTSPSGNPLLPYVTYTDPQFAHVGLHESELRSQQPDRKIKVAKMPMSYVARALETDESRGMMKGVVDAETGEILGFTCLGLEGGELMAVVQAAMMGGVTWMRLQDAVFAHPSLAESLNNLWGFLE